MILKLLPPIALSCLLAACSGTEVKESLGLMRNSPDEFKVVARPKLSVPPEFHLNPPQQGQQIDFGTDPEKQARALITEAGTENSTGGMIAADSADEQFLSRVGAGEADPGIRKDLQQEVTQKAQEDDPSWLDGLRGDTDAEPVVDAEAEALRLRENASEGKAVNEGEVPVIDPKEKSTLERLLD